MPINERLGGIDINMKHSKAIITSVFLLANTLVFAAENRIVFEAPKKSGSFTFAVPNRSRVSLGLGTVTYNENSNVEEFKVLNKPVYYGPSVGYEWNDPRGFYLELAGSYYLGKAAFNASIAEKPTKALNAKADKLNSQINLVEEKAEQIKDQHGSLIASSNEGVSDLAREISQLGEVFIADKESASKTETTTTFTYEKMSTTALHGQFKVGYNFAAIDFPVVFRPYLEVAHWHFFNDAPESKNARTYLGLGFLTTYNFSPAFSVGFDLMNTKTVYAAQAWEFGEKMFTTHGGKDDVGLRLSIPFQFNSSYQDSTWSVKIAPFYQRFAMNQNSNILGLLINVGILF